jgi:hypothetical protein
MLVHVLCEQNFMLSKSCGVFAQHEANFQNLICSAPFKMEDTVLSLMSHCQPHGTGANIQHKCFNFCI